MEPEVEPVVQSSGGTMRDRFPGYYRPVIDTIVEYLRGGLVAVDANVLLSLYRYTPTAREQLLGALAALGERLWVPHQVALEYQRNRLAVLREQQTRAADARKAVEQLAQQSVEKLTAVTNRAGVTPVERDTLIGRLQRVYLETGDRVEKMLAEAAWQPDNPIDDDPVRAQLDHLLRVGPPLDDHEHKQALTESKRRKEAKEPPGYKDTSHGDYLLWRQLLDEAGRRHVPVVLVTDDRKEDWQRIENGRHLGAHPALVEEMHRQVAQPFVLLESPMFLRLAGDHLQVPVSPGTLAEASQAPAEPPSEAAARRHQARLISAMNEVSTGDLLDAVRRLKADQQECIVLRFVQGLSVAETAAVMGRTEGAIKQLQLRGLRSLARILPEGTG